MKATFVDEKYKGLKEYWDQKNKSYGFGVPVVEGVDFEVSVIVSTKDNEKRFFLRYVITDKNDLKAEFLTDIGIFKAVAPDSMYSFNKDGVLSVDTTGRKLTANGKTITTIS
jgi:hypothetical protein